MKKVLLGDVVDIIKGISYRSSEYSSSDDGVAFINLKSVARGGGYNPDGVKYYAGQIKANQYVEAGDILIANTDLTQNREIIGSPIIMPNIDRKACFSLDLSKIVIKKPDVIYPKYLFYYLKSPLAREFMLAHSNGSTVMHLSIKSVPNMEIKIPSIEKQKKIADILDTLDEKIGLNRRMNETLEQIGQTLFRHYFIDNPERKKWDTVPLSELCDNIASGGTPSTRIECYYDGSIQWYSTKELKDSFMLNSEKTITHNGLENSSAKIFPADTVVMAIYAAPTVGRLGILTKEAAFNQAACGLVAKAEIGYEFIYLYLFLSRNDLNNLANGAAQQNISVGKVRSFGVIKPDSQTLSEFKTKIETVFQKIKNNYQEIETLVKIRDSLLPKLISGEISV